MQLQATPLGQLHCRAKSDSANGRAKRTASGAGVVPIVASSNVKRPDALSTTCGIHNIFTPRLIITPHFFLLLCRPAADLAVAAAVRAGAPAAVEAAEAEPVCGVGSTVDG